VKTGSSSILKSLDSRLRGNDGKGAENGFFNSMLVQAFIRVHQPVPAFWQQQGM
jgi:hypothetical protein